MGLFGNKENKQEKQQKELEEYMQKYGLNTLDEKDLEIIKEIQLELMGTGLIKLGTMLSFGKAEDTAKLSMMSALMQQNWLIIKKLDEISKKLDTQK